MMFRRPGARFNRGRIPAGAQATFSPSSISGLSLWLDSETAYNTDGGNGTATSSMIDRSPTNASIIEGGAGLGALRLDPSGRRGFILREFTSGKWNKSTDATVCAIPGNTPQDFTVVQVYQPTSNGASYNVAWGNQSLTTRYLAVKRGTVTYTDQIAERDTVNNNAAIALTTTPTGFMPQICVTKFNAGAAQATRYIDGVSQGAVGVARTTTAHDIFAEGALPTGATPSLNCTQRRRHVLVYNRQLNASEIQQLTDWGATQIGTTGYKLNWKGGVTGSASFGNGSNAWLVVAVIGQSNGGGRGTSTYTSIYNGTSDQGYCLYNDGNLDAIADPTASSTDVVGGQQKDNGQEATSAWVRMVDYLRANGETRNIMVVNCCVGGTGSTTWNTSTTTVPPPANAVIGAAKLRIREALKAPNAELVTVVYQGENDSFNSGGSPAVWATNWGAILDELNTYFASAFVKTKRHFIINLPVTAYTSAIGSNWSDLRTNIATFANTTRADCTLVQAPNGPWVAVDNLHLNTGSNTPGAETGLMGLGVLVGAAIRAAT